MSSEFSGGGSGAPRDEQLIFMSDASAEAERLMSALRSRGYSVVEVPLSLLVGRVSVQKPALILCDVDATPALEQVRRLREVPGAHQIDVVFFGLPSRSLDELRDEVFHESSGFFVRPVDTFGLLRKVEALIGPPSEPDPARRGGGPSSRPPAALPRSGPDSARPPPRPEEHASSPPPTPPAAPRSGAASTTPPRAATRSSPVPDSGPSSLPPAHASLPPDVHSSIPVPDAGLPRPIPLGFGVEPEGGGSAIGRHVLKSEISPELESILARAEQRIGGAGASQRVPESLRLSPDDEVDAVLPADVLSALDEPLDIDEEEDEEAGTGSGGGSSPGGSARTGMFTASGTSGGRTGVGAVVPAPIPTSDPAGVPGPTVAPPARENFSGIVIDSPVVGSPQTPPAVALGPHEPVAPVPPSASAFGSMTSVEARPMSVRDPDAHTAVVRPTPMPPAPTPDGLRLERSTRVDIAAPSSVAPQPPPAAPLEIPQALGRGDSARGLARAIRSRFSGAVAFESEAGIRRIVLRDGDFVTAASGIASESLVAFLTERGTLAPEVQKSLGHKLAAFGRHAGAALIAHGHLRQDELWPVLRAHAEWLVARALEMTSGSAGLEREVPARLQAEPAVFGGATGAEVYVEIVRRVVSADEAESRLGGPRARVVEGPNPALLTECALSNDETTWVARSKAAALGEVVGAGAPRDLLAVVYALVQLGVLEVLSPAISSPSPREEAPRKYDELDERALRARIQARKSLVEEGDYFALLGVTKTATTYDVQRAYTDLRLEFEPSRILTASTAGFREDVDMILEVLDEAYEILSDQMRRERYRRALEATPG